MSQYMYPSMLEFILFDIMIWTVRAACVGFFGGLFWNLGRRLANMGSKN